MISTLEKLKRLERYLSINNSTVDPVIETTLNKRLSREFNRMEKLKKRLSNELHAFEKQYNMQSKIFHQRFEAGKLGDAVDFIEWTATIEMLSNVNQRLDLLEAADAR